MDTPQEVTSFEVDSPAKLPAVQSDEYEALPPMYQRLVSEAFGGALPRERKATCSSCAMCSEAQARISAETFRPDSKCCTYLPDLKNFLVGRILATDLDAEEHGRVSLRARIEQRVAVSPLGVGSTPLYSLKYTKLLEPNETGWS